MKLPQNWSTGDILVLAGMPALNAGKLKKIVDTYSSLDSFFKTQTGKEFESKLKQENLFESDREFLREQSEKQIEICAANDYKMVSIWDEAYPDLLKEIIHPPVIIFVWGNLQAHDSASISVVGTRKCTSYGKLTAERFAEYFSRNKIITTSGLAYGIDTAAHLASLRSEGITYAVIASGLNEIGPAYALKNAEKIVDSGGAIISEYKCGVKARPAYFPQRNRIISGISRATVVIESAEKGGALITARFANDQQREVFAVPGNITSSKSIGTNNLIKNSLAIPALSPGDILQELGFLPEEQINLNNIPEFSNPAEKKIFEALSFEPCHIDVLAEKTETDVSALLVSLLNMEFKGTVKQLPGKHYIRS